MEYSEKERNILKQVLNGMKIGNIAEENGITLEELYIFLEKYCEDNNVVLKHNLKDHTREFIPASTQKKKHIKDTHRDNKKIEIVTEIENWCIKNQRIPTWNLHISVASKENQGTENETEEQIEKRIWAMYSNLKTRMNLKYGELVDVDTIDNNIDKYAVTKLRELEWKYAKRRGDILNQCIKAVELRKWCKENGRLPERTKNVKIALDIENETKEQKELRMYYALIDLEENFLNEETIKNKIVPKREKKLEIYKILIELRKKYSRNNVVVVSNKYLEHKSQLAISILNLVDTKNATIEEIKKIADYYNIDLESILQENDIKDFEDEER